MGLGSSYEIATAILSRGARRRRAAIIRRARCSHPPRSQCSPLSRRWCAASSGPGRLSLAPADDDAGPCLQLARPNTFSPAQPVRTRRIVRAARGNARGVGQVTASPSRPPMAIQGLGPEILLSARDARSLNALADWRTARFALAWRAAPVRRASSAWRRSIIALIDGDRMHLAPTAIAAAAGAGVFAAGSLACFI